MHDLRERHGDRKQIVGTVADGQSGDEDIPCLRRLGVRDRKASREISEHPRILAAASGVEADDQVLRRGIEHQRVGRGCAQIRDAEHLLVQIGVRIRK